MLNHHTRIFIFCTALVFHLSGFSLAEDYKRCLNTNADNECQQNLVLDLGGSEVLDIGKPSKQMKLVTSNEKVVDVRPLKENKIYIRGTEVGHTTLTVYDQTNGMTVAKIEVDVQPLAIIAELSNLKEQISKHFPNQDINVDASQKGLVLYGTVTGPEIVDQVLRLAEGYVSSIFDGKMTSKKRVIYTSTGQVVSSEDDEMSETGKSGPEKKIINLLRVGGPQQVLLEVKFAEVIRDSSMNWSAGLSYHKLGQDFGGIIGGGSVIPGGSHYGDVSRTDSGSIITDFVGDAANILLKIDNVNLALEFLEGEGLAKTLAEPRLVALSGQEAKFLAGGQFPYQTIQSTSGSNNAPIAETQFKDFGVALKFTPIVQSNGLITLRVAPSVSQITDTIESISGVLPLVDTRELETTAQLHDGQTLVLAGLLREDMSNAINKVPMLGDIPIIGSLFKSNSFINKKSDLVISITPHLVKPTKEGSISYPGEFIKQPNRFEFYLLGKLEGHRSPNDFSKISQHNYSFQNGGGLEGSFGHLDSPK